MGYTNNERGSNARENDTPGGTTTTIKTVSFKSLNLKSKDFCLCVEIPIKAKRKGMSYTDTPSYERKRKAGEKKVNEFKDGFKIFLYMIKRFFK